MSTVWIPTAIMSLIPLLWLYAAIYWSVEWLANRRKPTTQARATSTAFFDPLRYPEMKKCIPVVLAIACLLLLVSDSQAFFRRSVEKVVVRQNVQKVVVQQQVQKVVQQKIVVQEVQQIQKVQKVVVQPVQLVQQAYAVQAVQIQPVQAVYQVQQLQSYGYGAQALNLGSACSTSAAQIQQLQQQVQQLQQAEVQRLQAERQRLTAPMNPPK